jgi:hypothetical protein
MSTESLLLPAAAEYIQMSEATLRYWRLNGIGPASYLRGHRLFYDIADLDAWLAEQKKNSLRGGVSGE